MTEKHLRDAALPRPFEMAAVVLSVLIYVFFLPSEGHDLAVRFLCLIFGAGSLAIYNDYRRRARAKAKTKSWTE